MLSICIPTYNRVKYLERTILSISDQVTSNIAHKLEICISDNNSDDGTDLLIAKLQEKSVIPIVYSKSDRNMGADLNYLRAVELASGDYCWFMGSDDVVVAGSLQIILDKIGDGHDIYLCNRVDCDIEMNHIEKRYWLKKGMGAQTFQLEKDSIFNMYANNSNSVGALFAYLSSIVFKTERWRGIKPNSLFIGTAYMHVYMLLSFITRGCTLSYIPAHLINCRGENDSFRQPGDEGVVNRIMLDIDGYLLIANILFLNSPIYFKSVLRVLRSERPQFRTMITLRIRMSDAEWQVASEKFIAIGYSSWLVALIGYSKPVLITVKKIRMLIS